jgi:hypothetical protein
MKMNYIGVLVVFAAVVYGISLFTPYYFSTGPFSSIRYVSGFQFGTPLLSLLLIIPIALLTITKLSRKRKWQMLITSIFLAFPVNIFLYILIIELNKYNDVIFTPAYLGFGYYAHIAASLLLLIAGILNFKQAPSKTRKTNQDLIDSF